MHKKILNGQFLEVHNKIDDLLTIIQYYIIYDNKKTQKAYFF